MHNFKQILGASILLLVSVSSVQASVVWNVGFNDRDEFSLMGAQNVDVLGKLYDVEFLQPSCNFRESCGYDGDLLTFHTETEAKAASQALLDQVFLDAGPLSFDSNPELTNGCNYYAAYQCWVVTLFEIAVFEYLPTKILGAAAVNKGIDTGPEDVRLAGADYGYGDYGYAKWSPSPVPVPAAAWLFGTAILGLIGFNKRRKVT